MKCKVETETFGVAVKECYSEIQKLMEQTYPLRRKLILEQPCVKTTMRDQGRIQSSSPSFWKLLEFCRKNKKVIRFFKKNRKIQTIDLTLS